MVRINLIEVHKLADQHLIAEYNEILMLLGYVRKHPKLENIPLDYALGKGHIRFFKNKLLYLQKRHELIKEEMIKRGFNAVRTISLASFPLQLRNDWKPHRKDYDIIVKRLTEKLMKKPHWYRYYGKNEKVDFFIHLLTK